MSSSIDKKYGNLYIFGKYPGTDYVDVSWSVSQDTILEHVKKEQAEKLIDIWNDLLECAEEQL